MKIVSLTEVSAHYIPIEVEVSLIPGLPQIHFLGRADASLKESGLRIKSAFRSCGLKFPQAQQVVVNLTPSHFKKVSPGIELAVAIAILKLTEQGPIWDPTEFIIFGELSLSGDIRFPQITRFFDSSKTLKLLSGQNMESYSGGYQLKSLKDLESPKPVVYQATRTLVPPVSPVSKLTVLQAEALLIMALGGHHVLLAGAQGSGKTLMAEALYHLLEEPELELSNWHEALFQKPLNWRPMARPHHTISPLSMVGGGVPPRPGEITRAHGGVLLLDEMMEFKPATLEVLREALSSEQVTVSRGLQSATFQSKFQLIGTTNLCPCGKWTPGKTRNCNFNEKRCHSVLQRLSGPLMDRLQGVFYFSAKMDRPQIKLEVLHEQLRKARHFKRHRSSTPNRYWGEQNLDATEFRVWNNLLETFDIPSVRRRQGCVGWARTLADLEFSPQIQQHHFQKAYEQSVLGFEQLFQ